MRYFLFAFLMSLILLSGCGQQDAPAQTASDTATLTPSVIEVGSVATEAVATIEPVVEPVASESVDGK
jgi:PBP1b-binding outer membrane lipoprotein LpoB